MSGQENTRPPAVAGQFYPEQPLELREMIWGFLRDVPGEARSVPAAMVPHAGLMYSGACAAQVFGRLALPPLIVILAPNHTGAGGPNRAALWRSGAFDTPLGPVQVAEQFARRLESSCELVREDRAAHREEHAIEVELPFLRVLEPAAMIAPLVLSWDDWPRSERLARALATLIAGWPERVLLLASSDMTHYESAGAAAAKDRVALAHLAHLDGEGLLQACREQHITMCGRAPAATVIETARLLGATSGTVVDYRHSGLVTGDDRRVVAYAGLLAQ
jgi:AmmeMemoRadiSam system protein B